MRFLSLFSGIEAASQAWVPLGWECVAVAEIDPFASAALAHRHPTVPNLGDITKITEMDIAALGHIDLVVFGSPCQDLSLAGKQKGLSGERSGLFFPAVDIIRAARLWCGCRFALWENVPGAFSSNKGRDFAAVVAELAGLDECPVPPKGWGTEGAAVGEEGMVEWATLDAQWFGVAQRRRRVFALADFGDWTRRQPVLLEPDRMRGDSAPRRETGQGTAGSLTASAGRRCGVSEPDAGSLIAAFGGNNQSGPIDVATARNACASASGRLDFETETFLVQEVAHTLRGEGFDASEDGTGRGTPLVPVETEGVRYAYYSHDYANDRITDVSGVNPALTATANASGNLNVACPAKPSGVLAFDCKSSGQNGFGVGEVVNTLRAMGSNTSRANGGGHAAVAYSTKLHNTAANNAGKLFEEYTACLDANSPAPALLTALQVRRLTPTECERLQGFPDGHTAIPYRGKPAEKCPDGPRYKALGNSMAVPVMRWIGERLTTALLFED